MEFKPKDESAWLKRHIQLLEWRIAELEGGIKAFVDKNYSGGSKADREDYGQMVTAKDIYDLRKLIIK